MNGDMIRFNPGDIILRRGDVPSDIYLVVTGMLELLDSDIDIANHLGAGGMVGDVAGLARQPSKTTYRAMTHVRALRLPRSQLLGVMRKGGRAARMERRREAREFLEETWVFDGLSAAVQNRIAKSMITVTYEPGDIIDHEAAPAVFLLGQGSVDIRFGEKTLHTLRPGEFLGEGFVIFETPCITTGYAMEPTTMFVVPAAVVEDIPVVRWKLFETFRARVSAIVESVPAGEDIFNWAEEFSTGVEKQDQDHREILEYAAKVHRVLREQGTDAELDTALEEFQACAARHFARETAWYARERFPELEHHELLHANLLRDMRRKVRRIRSDCPVPDVEFEMFFKVWLIDHILTEDRKFGALMALRKARGKEA